MPSICEYCQGTGLHVAGCGFGLADGEKNAMNFGIGLELCAWPKS
jgi:hypothetical protein